MLIVKYIIIILVSFFASKPLIYAQTDNQESHSKISKLIREQNTTRAKDMIDSLFADDINTKTDYDISKLYRLKSRYFKSKYLLDSAIYYQNKALEYLPEKYFDQHNYSYLSTLAYYHWESGNYSKSLTYSHQILRNIEETDSSRHDVIYNILGITYLELGDYQLSEKYLMKAAEYGNKFNNHHYLGVVYANIGKLYAQEGKFNKALQYFNKGSNLELKYNDYQAAGRSYVEIGKLYIQRNQFSEAYDKLQKAISFAENDRDSIGLCRAYLAFGELYFKQDKFEKAKGYYNKAVNLAQSKNTQKELMEGYKGLHETYTKLGSYKQANYYNGEYITIYKDLYSIQKIIQIENLQHELRLQKEKTASQKAQLEKQETINNLLFIVIALALIASVALSVLLIRSRKNRLALKRKNLEIEQQKNNLEKLNKELEKARIQAENSEALKDQFLRNISHEIRTPLNGIIGFSSIIAQPDITSSERNRYQKIVERNAKLLISTIEDIIDIAKIRSHQINIFKEKFDVNALLKELQKLFYFEKTYLNKENIEILLEGELAGKQYVYTDESKIRKILLVLGNNALKFSEEGYIKLGYSIKNSNIVFSMEDTGIGISKEDQQTIFETFRQADSSMERAHDGIGLGLTIAKAFVEMMGGKIWFESTVNAGTKFYFNIPLTE